ncbi:MAG: carbonic anhydrase [Bacteroidetes bacterium]|nr:carbonic anhydrase [Bacteroidota bacterium]
MSSEKKNTTKYIINTPDEALAELKNGNKRFSAGRSVHTDFMASIESTKDDPRPHTIVLSCFDSRVPPEIIFDQGIGNIFVARVAGNIADKHILGSLEFGAQMNGSKLIVVMGHSKCGAVKGAIENAELGHLTQLVNVIKPAITGDKSDPEEMVNETARKNVRMTIEYIMKNSEVLSGLVKEGKLKIAGAFYDVSSGKVDFLD